MSVNTEPRLMADEAPEKQIIDRVPSQEELDQLKTLDDMFGAQAEQTEGNTTETLDNRELSPTATSLNRIIDAMNRRALNRAHGQALRENGQRDVVAQSEAFDSYVENIDATQNREDDELEYSNDREKAHKANNRFNAKAERKYSKDLNKAHKINSRFDVNAQSEAFDSYAENIDATQNREDDELEYSNDRDAAHKTNNRIDAAAERGYNKDLNKAHKLNNRFNAATERKYSNDREDAYQANDEFDVNAQSEAFDSYTENINATQDREQAERKAQQKEAFEQARLEAKATLAKTGRFALKHTVNAGVIALGLGLIAGEAVAKTTVAVAEKTKSVVELGVGVGINVTDAAVEKTAQFIEKGEDIARGVVEAGKEAFISYREKLIAYAVAAGERKDARKVRRAGKRAEYKARGQEAIESSKKMGPEAARRFRAAKSAGRVALKTGTQTYKAIVQPQEQS